jgi:hypothetical protein
VFGIERLRDELRTVVRRLDAATLETTDAAALVSAFGAIENLAAAGKARCARRVADSGAWRSEGDRSGAHWLARVSGTTVSAATDALETVARLEDLPVVDAAVRTGVLNPWQANEIASAAAASPEAAAELLHAAEAASLVGLRNECRTVRAGVLSGDEERARSQRIHDRRHLRTWTDDDGAVCGRFSLTPDAGASFLAALERRRDRIFAAARQHGRREPYEAYNADALVALATSAPGGGEPLPKGADAKIILRLDYPAFVRGHTERGETCEIAGIGPVPVTVARELAQDAFIAAVITKGVDVATVAHLGRRPTALQRTALQWRDPECCVEGCHQTARLEIDHREDWARTKRTRLKSLDRLCDHHHDLKTRYGWRLDLGTGKRPTRPPPKANPESEGDEMTGGP